MALPEKISCLVSIEAQINENPAESFDLALTTVFNNYEDLATYATHPDHVAAASIFKAVAAGRACVDYTFYYLKTEWKKLLYIRYYHVCLVIPQKIVFPTEH